MGEGKTVDHWDAWTATMQAKHGNGNGHGKSLAIEAQRLLPTPRTSDTNGAGAHGTGGPDLRTVVDLLPTPTVNDAGNVGGASQWERNSVPLSHALLPTPRATDGTKGGPNQRGPSGDLMLPSAVQLLPTPRATQAGYANDGRGGKSLDVEARRHLLPTPTAVTRDRSPEELKRRWIDGERGTQGRNLDDLTAHIDWGDYVPAIARWEHILGRPAPAPTEPGPKGSPRLSAAFVEWLMGLPAGHVTDVDIPRNAQLKALGNGVVPQQAAAAARWWLAQIQETAA